MNALYLYIIFFEEGTEYIQSSTVDEAVKVFRRMTTHYRRIIRITEYVKVRVINA